VTGVFSNHSLESSIEFPEGGWAHNCWELFWPYQVYLNSLFSFDLIDFDFRLTIYSCSHLKPLGIEGKKTLAHRKIALGTESLLFPRTWKKAA
jgi:hypothetical protein